MDSWLNSLREAKKSCVIQDGKKKVLYTFPDGNEMAEEYNRETNVVTRRAWKKGCRMKTQGDENDWEIEIGDPSLPKNVFETPVIELSSSEPVMSTRITKGCLEWRIRNLPYSLDTYVVTANEKQRCIVVRTTNSKFFKKISIPDFDRLKIPIEQERITVSHKYNTLIISYKKPAEMMAFEKLLLEELNKLEAPEEAPLQCPTS